MRYKILFISSWFPNKLEPTNGNFVQRHAEAVSRIHDVQILHTIGDSQQKEKFVFDEKMINGIKTLVVYYRNTQNPLLNFTRRMQAYKKGFAKLEKPDLVHANVLHNSMLFAVYLKKKIKIPFVVTEHWSAFLEINRHKLSQSQLFVAKNIAKNASLIIPVSHFLMKDLKAIGLQNKMRVVENVVDTDLFQVKEHKNDRFVFLHISNLVKLKNPEGIINTACRLYAEIPDFELQIGGDGDVESINKLIREKLASHFIKTFPLLTLNEVSEKMRSSDCFILFSEYENFPCVLLESLSAGTAAIATNVGGIPEIINDSNGMLISPSEEELFEAMKKVLKKELNFASPQKLHDEVVNRFSMEEIARKFDLIYREILDSTGS
ncbi:MAG: glycosyltransferase [Kaistella sp.]|nr:glycosyltransferase [Kaistella sp.]